MCQGFLQFFFFFAGLVETVAVRRGLETLEIVSLYVSFCFPRKPLIAVTRREVHPGSIQFG